MARAMASLKSSTRITDKTGPKISSRAIFISGDTLSKIAKQYYGDANAYPRIFEANKPMLSHPDRIYPGQTLRIPPK